MRYMDLLGGGQQEATIVIKVDPTTESVEIPNGNFLLTADYSRIGQDLMLEGPGGAPVLVQEYFSQGTPPLLTTEKGAEIWPELVQSLTGPLAPGQIAQDSTGGRGTEPADLAQAASGGSEIGKVTEQAGDVRVVRTSGVEEPLRLGDLVYQGDVLITTDGSSVGLTFIDNTLFSLTGKGRLVLDQVIFNPAGANNELSLSLVQGVFAFVSGEIAGSDGPGMSIRTPVATVGVRGTTGGGAVGDAPGTGDFQAIFALLNSLLGNLGAFDVQVANAVLTLAVALATAGITADGEIEPTDFTPELQAALANAIVSLRISLAQLIENLEPGAGGDDILPGQGSDADPEPNNFFNAGNLNDFGQEFGESPLGDIAGLLTLLDELLGFVGPETDPNLISTVTPPPTPEGEGPSVLALNINMIVTEDPFIDVGSLFAATAFASSFGYRSLNDSPFIGFVKADAPEGTSIDFSVTGGSAVPYLYNFGTSEEPRFFDPHFGKFFKFFAPSLEEFAGEGGEAPSSQILSFNYLAQPFDSELEPGTGTVFITVRNQWDFGEWVPSEWGYVTNGSALTDIIYANRFIDNFDYFQSQDTDWDGGSYVQILKGFGGHDALVGAESDDFFFLSQDGDDYMEIYEDLRGGPGDDILLGLSGNDILDGGPGDDLLFGDFPSSVGEDTFLFRMSENSGNDIIFDIDGGESSDFKDTIKLADLAPEFDTTSELDLPAALEAGFSVTDDGTDVTVTFGQGGGSVTILDLGDGSINSFDALSLFVNLELCSIELPP